MLANPCNKVVLWGVCIVVINFLLAAFFYETIGWCFIRNYSEVMNHLVYGPIGLQAFANLGIGIVFSWFTIERTPEKVSEPRSTVLQAPSAIAAIYLSSGFALGISLLVMPMLGPQLNHLHLLSTPLDQAARYQDDSLVISKVVGGENSNVQASVTGKTPLHYMAGGNKLAAVKVLLENGAKPNVTDEWGKTPLHWAVWNRADVTIVQLLLDAGASPFAKDYEGKTPVDYANRTAPPLGLVIRTALLKAGNKPLLLEPVKEPPKVSVPNREL